MRSNHPAIGLSAQPVSFMRALFIGAGLLAILLG
jgi:hypothetical protein